MGARARGGGRLSTAYVGSLTTPHRGGSGTGLTVHRVHDDPGAEWEPLQTVPETNPSWLVPSADGTRLHAVHADGTSATTYAVDPGTGLLERLGTAACGGTNPAHAALVGPHLLTAEYATGTVSALPVRADGTLGDAEHVLTLPGEPGPHPVEQTSSHPHQVLPVSASAAWVCDKGLDRLFLLEVGAGGLEVRQVVEALPGSGPRHAAAHPRLPRLYVADELSSSVTVLDTSGAVPVRVQVLPTLPAGADPAGNTPAAVVVARGGSSVHVTNRGHDSVASFAVDPASGDLRPVRVSRGGAVPRFAAAGPGGDTLLVAHERGHDVVEVGVDEAGRLGAARVRARTPSPVCVVVLP
ncbi:lactonase family protein [Kineococcus terrestris]|uniref:lactonase family protein n=1 Tax=Kineococcus terrestris TaxID=2044856 RepID=UPI0034DB35A6